MTNPLGGGCLCGAVRYEVDRIFDVVYCHCSRCRKTSGAPVLACARVEPDAFRVTRGVPRVHRSSAEGDRCFCGDCGSALWFAGARGGYFSVHVGTLDDPEQAPPRAHICDETRLRWLALADDLPRFPGTVLPHPDRR